MTGYDDTRLRASVRELDAWVDRQPLRGSSDVIVARTLRRGGRRRPHLVPVALIAATATVLVVAAGILRVGLLTDDDLLVSQVPATSTAGPAASSASPTPVPSTVASVAGSPTATPSTTAGASASSGAHAVATGTVPATPAGGAPGGGAPGGAATPVGVSTTSGPTDASASAPPVTDSRYYRFAVHQSAQCVEVTGTSASAGSLVVQMNCRGVVAQTFQVGDAGGGYMMLVSATDGRCLTVSGASGADDALVVAARCGGSANQQWSRVELAADAYRLVARHSGKCLAVKGASTVQGASLVQAFCTDASEQKFAQREVRADGSVAVVGAPLVNQKSRTCLEDIHSSLIPGARAVIRTCVGAVNQSWTYTADRALTTLGMCLDVNGEHAVGSDVFLQACRGSADQQWEFRNDRTVRHVGSGLCLHVANGSTADGTVVDLARCSSSDAVQRWTWG